MFKKFLAWLILKEKGISTAKIGAAISFLSGIVEIAQHYGYLPESLEKPFAFIMAIGAYILANGIRNAIKK